MLPSEWIYMVEQFEMSYMHWYLKSLYKLLISQWKPRHFASQILGLKWCFNPWMTIFKLTCTHSDVHLFNECKSINVPNKNLIYIWKKTLGRRERGGHTLGSTLCRKKLSKNFGEMRNQTLLHGPIRNIYINAKN